MSDLAALLRPGDLVVLNETKVIPARLVLRRGTGGAAEVLMLEPVDGERRVWEALVRPARKLKPGETLFAPDGTPVVEIGGRTADGDTFTVSLVGSVDSLQLLETHGEMPLPPYITERLADPDRYQTIYARQPGSAAAPTAGLHVTDRLLADLARAGVGVAKVELGVGLDTFRPIATDDPLQHRMHTERYRVPEATLEACRHAERVVAVGTTTVRALESAAQRQQLEGRTDIFHPSRSSVTRSTTRSSCSTEFERTERISTKKPLYADIVNVSMNQVLMRSLNTSFSAIIPVLSLLVVGAWIMGQSTLTEFAVALLIGMLTGAYSSILVAVPLLFWLKQTDANWKSKSRSWAVGEELREIVMAGGSITSPGVANTPGRPVRRTRFCRRVGRRPAGGGDTGVERRLGAEPPTSARARSCAPLTPGAATRGGGRRPGGLDR